MRWVSSLSPLWRRDREPRRAAGPVRLALEALEDRAVPAALLDLKDQYGVIRAQIPTALPLLAVNILIIYWAAFQ